MPKKKPAAPVKDKGGRPPKLTAAFLVELERLLIGGAYPITAVLALGVSRDSYNRWKDRGQPDGQGNYPDTPYGKFCGVLDRAPALARVGVDVAVHRLAKQGDISAAKLYYQRVRAENFEPHNLNPTGLLPLTGNDDDDSLYASLASRLAGLSRTGGAEGAPR